MRWTDFFSHLEHDFALDSQPPRESGLPRHNSDSHFLDMCARAKASGREVAVGIVTGEVLHVFPRAISTDWFSGLVGSERGSGVVIPMSAVVWAECDTKASPGERVSLIGVTLTDVLSDMARRQSHLTVRTQHRDIAGVIIHVGEGFFDVAGHPATDSGAIRRVAFHAIAAIFQGTAAWG